MRELLRTRTVPVPGAQRPRRLRRTAALRALVKTTRLDAGQLVMPLFIISGRDRSQPIPSLPGHSRLSADLAVIRARELARLGGVLSGGEVDNDATLPLLAEAAVAYADAGADVVGPSGMMDGQVAALRAALDGAGHAGTAIMAYASKAASAYYAPFREAAGSTPAFGDRRGYQMDYSNAREAMREMDLDVREGADILMVKPALTSLDLLVRAQSRFDLPLAAYHVSGEVAMLEAAAERGWIDRRSAAIETLTAIVRAGAGIVITYLAADVAGWLREEALE